MLNANENANPIYKYIVGSGIAVLSPTADLVHTFRTGYFYSAPRAYFRREWKSSLLGRLQREQERKRKQWSRDIAPTPVEGLNAERRTPKVEASPQEVGKREQRIREGMSWVLLCLPRV